jgi:hypothetical protein
MSREIIASVRSAGQEEDVTQNLTTHGTQGHEYHET